MSRYEEFEAFVRTVEAKSFTAAAQQLGVAKSAISRRVSELEQRLDTKLINRSTRALSLTEAGNTLFYQARKLLEDWQEAECAARDEKTALSGTIRFAAPLSFGLDHLTPALLAFQANHPDMFLDVDFSDRQVDLTAEGIDLAVRIGRLRDSSLIARKLANVRMIAAASPAYLEAKGVPTTPSDLTAMRELRYTNRLDANWIFTAPDGHTHKVSLDVAMRSSNGKFLKQAAIAGHGLTIQPSFILYDALRDGRLVQVLPGYQLEQIGIYAIYPQTRHLSHRVRALVDHLASHCGETPYWDIWTSAP